MTKLFDLTGTVAIVTGGNGGIGLGIARGLLHAAAQVAIVARNPEKSRTAAQALAAETGAEPLELPDKTIVLVTEEDNAGSELDPTQIPLALAVKPPGDAAELRQEGVATLHRTADPTHPRLPRLAPLGGLHPEAGVGCSLLAGAVAVRPVRPRTGQVADVGLGHRHRAGRRTHHQRFQDRLRFDAVVDVGRRDHRPQRHPIGVAGYVDGSTTLTAIHGRGTGVLTPFFDGFLEPSSRT
jgi:NAD(P)-dependent dehydrogenase (short-subunit alcohol dehydrogenase family)